MTPEQEEKLAALKGGYLANLAKVRQAANANKDERDRAIAEHVNSYISEVGNDGELADAFLKAGLPLFECCGVDSRLLLTLVQARSTGTATRERYA